MDLNVISGKKVFLLWIISPSFHVCMRSVRSELGLVG